AKLEAAGEEKPELDAEFEKLRQITGNYTVPGDVCETYEAVYNMLAELDKAYQA
ncbi:MAG: iron-sulfur cluster repair di-iron protein, ric, partial [Firmicutes bacterium]|nr:iron-sulfur cluster repair di-iron protein, ric [Bacillota bacterium]